MEYLCLGPLEVRVDGVPVDLGGPQQRLVLAILLTRANEVVSTDRLIDDVWGEQPPGTARKTIQGYISGLRKLISADDALRSTSPGYLLAVKPDEVDSARFESMVAEGSELTTSDPNRAAQVLDQALSLWRGGPYEDLADHDALRPEVARLEQIHALATESRVAAEVFAGRASSALAELADLTRRFPLRERLWSLRMLALHRVGRQADALRVFDEARRILAEEVGLDPSAELRLLQQRILDQDPVLSTAAALDPDAAVAVASDRNPYKGLRAFSEADAADFHGREALVRRLTEAMDQRTDSRLVVVAGPSGSGKSSVLGAGLTPALRAEGWSIATMYPGGSPLETIETTVASLGSAPSVILVDQLEELITVAPEEAREPFLDELVELAAKPEGPWVVVAVRADFLDRLLVHPRFARLVEPAMVLVTPLEDHEVRDVIVGPASSAGVPVEPELVAAMVRDVGSSAAALPLLEYALADLYDRAGSGSLTLESLQAAGGISGALVKRAEELYSDLDESGRATTRQAFLRLVTLTEEGEALRRRIPTETLSGLAAAESVLEVFGRHRMLTFDRDHERRATVEVAHEVLLTSWPRLEQWIDEARADLALHRRLAEAVVDWEANDRSEMFLLSAARLGQHEEWTAHTELALTSAEEEYLAASRAWNETERRRRRRRRRWTLAGFAAAAVAAAGFGTAALINADRAAEHAAEAEAARSEAEARRISAQSKALAGLSGAALAEDPELGLLLAIEAAETEDNPAALKALQDALQAHRRRVAILGPEEGIEFGAQDAFSPNGRWLVSGGIAQTSDGPALQIWALGDPGAPVNTIPYEGYRSPFMAFSQESDAVLVMTPHTEDDAVRLNFRIFTVPEGELVLERDLPPLECVVPYEFPSQGSTPYFDLTRPILVGAVDPFPDGSCPEFGPATVWSFDLHTGDLFPLGPGSEFNFSNPTISEDGTRLASAQGPPLTPDGLPARGVFEVATGDLILELPYGVSALSADGTLVLAGANPVELLEVDTGRKLREFDADAPVDVYFSSDESLVYIYESTDVSRVFDRFTGDLLFEIPGAAGPQMAEDGRSLGSVGGPSLLHVSNIAAPLQSHNDPLTLLADGGFVEWTTNISDHRIVAVVRPADGDRASHVYDRHSGELLLTLDGIAGAISPDGTLVAIQARPGRIELDDEQGGGNPGTYVVFGPLQLVDLDTQEVTATLGGSCEWYNSVFVEIPGPDCAGFPVAWMDWFRDLAFSPDGALVAAAGKSGYVAVWDTSSGEMVWQLDTDAGRSLWPIGFPDVAFSPDGGELAVFEGDLNSRFGLLSIVGTNDWSTTWEYPTEHLVSELTYAPNGSYLIASTLGHTLELYDTSAGQHLGTLGPQAGPVVDVAVSPDSRLIATASDDGESWIWDVNTRTVRQRLAFPVQQRLINVEFLDDQAILLGSEFEAVVLFLDTDRLLQVAKSRLTRSLTQDECATYGIDPCPTLEEMLSR